VVNANVYDQTIIRIYFIFPLTGFFLQKYNHVTWAVILFLIGSIMVILLIVIFFIWWYCFRIHRPSYINIEGSEQTLNGKFKALRIYSVYVIFYTSVTLFSAVGNIIQGFDGLSTIGSIFPVVGCFLGLENVLILCFVAHQVIADTRTADKCDLLKQVACYMMISGYCFSWYCADALASWKVVNEIPIWNAIFTASYLTFRISTFILLRYFIDNRLNQE